MEWKIAQAAGESLTASMAFAGDRTPRENTSIFFPNWNSALATARLDPVVCADYAREITRFRDKDRVTVLAEAIRGVLEN